MHSVQPDPYWCSTANKLTISFIHQSISDAFSSCTIKACTITLLAYTVVRPQLLSRASDNDTGLSAAQCKTVPVY